MINYSRQEVEKQLVTDQTLWRRVPIAAGALLWPVEVSLLGWHPGWWVGALTVAVLGVASSALPPRLKTSIYLIDLLERVVKLPLDVCWLLLVWHLWKRELIFPLLGQPLAGALLITVSLWATARLLTFVARFIAQRAFHGGRI